MDWEKILIRKAARARQQGYGAYAGIIPLPVPILYKTWGRGILWLQFARRGKWVLVAGRGGLWAPPLLVREDCSLLQAKQPEKQLFSQPNKNPAHTRSRVLGCFQNTYL